MNAKQEYACGHCETTHGTLNDALECCPPKLVWVCDGCDGIWGDDKETAEQCCKDDDDE